MTATQLAKCRLALPGLRWSLTSEGCVGNRGLHRVVVVPNWAPGRYCAEWLWIHADGGCQTRAFYRATLASALNAVGREMQLEAGKLAALAGLRVVA